MGDLVLGHFTDCLMLLSTDIQPESPTLLYKQYLEVHLFCLSTLLPARLCCGVINVKFAMVQLCSYYLLNAFVIQYFTRFS